MADKLTLQKIAAGEDYLIKTDPRLGSLIIKQRPIVYFSRGDYFYSLCRSIIGQQISTAAARAIFNRLEAAGGLAPQRLLALSDSELRAVGLSKQKISYLRDLAGHFSKNPNVYNHLGALSDDAVIKDLIAVKGIGAWTAQMFLMFTLMRSDIFAPDDIGIQRAMKNLYGWEKVPSRDELVTFAERWQPYRTIACWHLWKSIE